MAKVICSEAIWRVVDRSMQILGGLGITDDPPGDAPAMHLGGAVINAERADLAERTRDDRVVLRAGAGAS